MQQTGVDDLLFWLTTSGGASALVAFLLGFSVRFTELPQKTQFIIRVVLMVVIALLAQAGIQFIPPETKAALAPYVNTVGVLLGGSFVVHQAGKTGEGVNLQRRYTRALAQETEVKKDGG